MVNPINKACDIKGDLIVTIKDYRNNIFSLILDFPNERDMFGIKELGILMDLWYSLKGLALQELEFDYVAFWIQAHMIFTLLDSKH